MTNHLAETMYRGYSGHVPGYTPRGPLYAATDASWRQRGRGGHGGIGYIVTDGRWGLKAWGGGPSDPSGPAVVLINELRAVGLLLDAGVRNVTVLTDSAGALSYLAKWSTGDVDAMPPGYDMRRRRGGLPPTLARIAFTLASRHDVRVEKVAAHTGDLLNEAADSLAAIARSVLQGDDRDPRNRAVRLVDGFLASYHG